MHIIALINNYLQNKTSRSWILFSFFLVFSIFYFFNLESYNFFSTDFHARYKPNGLNLIDQIINLNFYQISLFNYYLIPELITGFFIKIFPNSEIFSIGLNFLNIALLFLSFNLFFKSLDIKNNNLALVYFFIIFFSYIGNWIWCFWKLADIYFLFIFSLVFYFTSLGIKKKKISNLFIALIFVIISFFTKPQGISIISFYFLSIFLFFLKKEINFYKFIIITFSIYFIVFPIFT